ncbi:FctA domain-containing protein [Solobacterium moorei]|uniref:Spy0128 family protein n=1 Tax=Solobacterium moorei TaxID=102148 RepID=UPI0023F17F8A|nr:FctA domain-containing protein [Solobacterium moorei]MDI6415041.1 FctA domain-containing protein [Solobacterium moorei]
MKITRRLLALLMAFTFSLGLLSSTCGVYASTQRDGYNITISNVEVNPGTMTPGTLASLKFDFDVESEAGNALNPGDTITFSTNIGTMFGNLPITDLSIYSESGQKMATATITETEVKMTLEADFPADTNFLKGSLYTGARLSALENGAVAGSPVTKALTIEDASTSVTFKVKEPVPGQGSGGAPSDPDMRTINNQMLEKQGGTSGYDTARIKLIANQLGSLRLFNTYNNIDRSFGTYEEQTNMMVVDKIPGNGVVDPNTLSFTAVRYNWMEIPAGGNSHYAQAAPGSVMPIERGSNWLPVTQYFNQITQTSTDTYDTFYAKVKAQKLSYGVYRDPVTGGDTFIANMSNDTLKYTDLEPNLAGIDKIKDIYGANGASHGNVVTFFVEFDTHYPSISGVETLTNTGEVKSDQSNASASVNYVIDKAQGNATVSSGTINIKVVDTIDDATPVADAEFKIQVNINGTWQDYYIRGRKATAKTGASGVASISGLTKGNYRLIQIDSPVKYRYNNDTFKPNPAFATAGTLDAAFGTFSIQNATQPGFATIVPNYQTATAKISGQKKYVDTEDAGLAIPNNTFKVNLSKIAGEDYTGVTMPQNLTATVEDDGTYTFEEIQFTKQGTYKFTVKEDTTNLLPGVVYDSAEKTVTVTVRNDNGTLAAEVSGDADFKNVFNFAFTNFKVKKVLTGDAPTTPAEFRFELTAVSTTANVAQAPMPEDVQSTQKVVSVNGEGEVEFGEIEFEAVGKYTYKVVELNTNVQNYTYDQTEYTITVDVTTDRDNKLVASYEIKKGNEVVGNLVFSNKYEVPKPPVTPAKPAAPKTADGTGNMMFMFGTLVASMLLVLAVARFKKQLS